MVSEWIGKFLARNPFYLVSAALLLFGINRLSIDPNFLGAEEPKLAFNFAALQLYEFLLVFVAIVLGLKSVWYDSTLLVVLENGLLLVPFILVTQAILIGKGLAAALCVTGTLMAVARYDSLHRWLPQLRLSSRLLACGAIVLGLNLALPILFRSIMDADVANWETLAALDGSLSCPRLPLSPTSFRAPPNTAPCRPTKPGSLYCCSARGLRARLSIWAVWVTWQAECSIPSTCSLSCG